MLDELISKVDIVLDSMDRFPDILKSELQIMDANTQAAIDAVKNAVTTGVTSLQQVITDEATDIKTKFDAVIAGLPAATDPAVAAQLNQLATDVAASFSSLTSGVQNLSDNVATPTPPAPGETPVP